MDGTPDGVQKIYCDIKPIEVYVIPRNRLDFVQDDFEKNCLYVLVGDERTSKPSVYIGKTKGFSSRVKDHDSKKAFWKKAIVFMSNKKDDFSSDDVNYFEYKSISLAKEANTYDVSENKQMPQEPNLKETDVISASRLFEDIKFWLTYLDYPILEKVSPENDNVHSKLKSEIPVYHCYSEIRFTDAIGLFNKDTHEMVVLKDSIIARDVANSFAGKRKRDELIAGNCVMEENGFRLLNDLSFKTLSAASDFCLGRSSNGKTEWKTHRTAKDLKDGDKIRTIKEVFGL